MTRKEDDADPSGQKALDALVAGAFSASGEMIPATEDEVARAEAEAVEYEGQLPPSLASYRPAGAAPSSRVVPFDGTRRTEPRARRWLTHALAATLGAAAASALWLVRGERSDEQPLPAGEPRNVEADAALPPVKIALSATQDCPAECCAGPGCAGARAELKECSSGRRCIACALGELAETRYRIRVGALSLYDPAATLKAAGGSLEVCIRVGSSDFACAPGHANADDEEHWSSLPLVVSGQDALGGFELQVRPRKTRQVLASFVSPVRINPTLLCTGLSIKPKTKDGAALGVISVFLADTHYVELGRAAAVSSLLEHANRFEFGGASAKIFETTRADTERFALVLGPLGQRAAERLRWQLLEKGERARVVVGEDHQGSARDVR